MTSHHTNRSALPAEQPRFLTRNQAAVYADCSVRTIDRWMREGLLTRHTAFGGRRVMIDRFEIDRAMQPVPLVDRLAAAGE